MAGPSTRPKNKAQRPGAIVKEYSQQHRSKEELDADRKADAEKKKAAALVRSGKISNLAEIQEHLRQRDAAEQSRHTLTLKVPPKHRQQQISSGPGSANAQDDQQMLESPHELPSVGEYEATLQSDSVADLLANPPTAASMPAPLATIHLPAQATPVAKATRKEKNSNSVRRHDIEAITTVRSICLFLIYALLLLRVHYLTFIMATEAPPEQEHAGPCLPVGNSARARVHRRVTARGPCIPAGNSAQVPVYQQVTARGPVFTAG
ncbi:hypothetical protein C8Q72DRAFT_792262 [Fomitopsis betulina]|nr:hypothetical protein C8Q72DRAFT_796004 [Fomitopsis betulina]KAI0734090.1 hypothetical protein C8Q72DRAFT_792262 [Fomitopsis betulina]